MPPAPHRRRRRVLYGAAATILTTALLTVLPQTAAQAVDPLISQSRPALASSVENVQGTPAYAVDDGNLTTRWASQFSDPQWIQIDLGTTATISQVELHWEVAYAQGVPDPDVARRHHVDDHLLDHDRHRRHPDARRSPAPVATCGCTARSAAPSTATRCTSSRSTASLPPPPGRLHPGQPAGHRRRRRRSTPRRTRTSTSSRPTARSTTSCRTTRSCSRTSRVPRTCTRSWATRTTNATTTRRVAAGRRHHLPRAGRQVGLLDADDVQRQHP